MLDRYVIPPQVEVEQAFAPARRWWKFAACYNAAPGRYVPVLRLHEGSSEGVMMRWGLIPAAAEGRAPAYRTSAVAPDELLVSPDCREPWLEGRRCILPIAGFYVWQRSPAGHRQPYFVRPASGRLCGVAGLWERSVSEEDDVIESCAFIAMPPSAAGPRLGGARLPLPAILRRGDHQTWLHARPGQAMEILRALPVPDLRHHPVGPWVNVPGRDDPTLIEPVEPETFALGASFRPPG